MVKGKKVGKYELGRTLGSGSFSKVKLGVDDHGGQHAVKIIDKEQIIREKLEEQLKLEISIMRMLDHPNVVKLSDVLQTSNNIYLVLELVTGGELFDRIVSVKRFDEDTARRYFQQMVVALHFCHSRGVAHRDLKPENLLLSDKDTIKITDFGLATMQNPSDKKLLRTVCGTPNYVAPEVLKEQGYVGTIADVWSSGVILFVMLAGYLPFDDPKLNALFAKVERGEYKMCATFSDSAKDIIAKMLTLDPKKRPSLEQVMSHPWFMKNWDKKVHDDLSGNTLAPVKDEAWASVNEKETNRAGPAANGPVANLGAFELITQLSMSTMSSLTSSRPVIKLFTRFVVDLTEAAANQATTAALEKLTAAPKVGETPNEIKGFQNRTKGLLTYIITLYPLVDPGMTMIEVRRGRGDTFDFHDLYHELVKALGSVVLSKPATHGQEAAPSPA